MLILQKVVNRLAEQRSKKPIVNKVERVVAYITLENASVMKCVLTA